MAAELQRREGGGALGDISQRRVLQVEYGWRGGWEIDYHRGGQRTGEMIDIFLGEE